MPSHPIATAAAAAVLLTAVAAPALAGTRVAAPSVGAASSGLTLVNVSIAGHDVRVGSVQLVSDTTGSTDVARAVVTPVRVDGTPYGEQTINPGSSPATVPVFNSSAVAPAIVSSLVSVSSPVINVASSNNGGPASSASASSLGGARLLGLPVSLNGTFQAGSAVTSARAAGTKSFTLSNVALPSIADILAAQGLSLPALPTSVLTDLVNKLGLANDAVSTASAALAAAEAPIKSQLDAAQAQVNTAAAAVKTAAAQAAAADAALAAARKTATDKTAAVTQAQTAVTAAQSALTAANAQLAAATTALNAALAGNGLTSLAAYNALPASSKSALAPTMDPLIAAQSTASAAVASATAVATKAGSDLAAAQSAVAAADAAVALATSAADTARAAADAAVAALDSARAALAALLATVQSQIDAVVAAVTAVLDGTPLASIDKMTVATRAVTTSAASGGQVAEVVGGQVEGLKVMGTDVLKTVLGSSSIDAVELVGGTLAAVNSKIDGISGTLSGVLSNVPGLPALSIPAPNIDVLTKSASTSITGGFGTATDSVQALRISLPAVAIPSIAAIPGAGSLPVFSGIVQTAGTLVSNPATMGFGTLTEQSKFRPAVVAAPPVANPTAPESPTLPRTGLPVGVAAMALLMVGSALVLRRRMAQLG